MTITCRSRDLQCIPAGKQLAGISPSIKKVLHTFEKTTC
jgi:hypothetical protein